MVGKAEVPRWRYDFDCNHCTRVQFINDGVRNGFYCIPMIEGNDPIHADNDRVVRCDDYCSSLPDQISLFDN